jgi:outer membrane immunogenic protein
MRDRQFSESGGSVTELISRNLWDAGLSVRSGLAFERAFVYGKLGAVFGRFEYSDVHFHTPPSDSHDIRARTNLVGVLIGTGFEYAITNNWSARFEYNYIHYGTRSVNFTGQSCDGGGTCVPVNFSDPVREIKQLARFGLSYRFGGDAIVARY